MKAAQRLEPTRNFIGIKSVSKMTAKVIVAFVVIPLHSGTFDRPAHPLDLHIGRWTVGLCPAMFDTVGLADQFKPHLAEHNMLAIARLIKLKAIYIANAPSGSHRARTKGRLR